MKYKKCVSFNLLLVLCLFVGLQSVCAQQTDNIKRNKEILDSVFKSENLVALRGNANIFYTAGFDVRAKTIQKLFNNSIDFYTNIFPEKKFLVSVYLLNKSDWNKLHFFYPYGLPFYEPTYEILVVPAEKDALAKLAGLKDIPKTPDSVLTGLDYQPLHELGHYFFFTLNNIYKEKWFNEFLATYFLICYVKEKNLEPSIETKLEEELKADSQEPHKSLNDFENLYFGVGPKNYGWYQNKFAQLALKLYPQFKTDLIKKVLDNYKADGKNLEGVLLLKNIAPEIMNEWLKEMQ